MREGAAANGWRDSDSWRLVLAPFLRVWKN